MNKILLVFNVLFFIGTEISFCQDSTYHRCNLIITIDDVILISPSKIQIILEGKKKEVEYIPGELRIKINDWKEIENYGKFSLEFFYQDFSVRTNNTHFYNIEIMTNWLEYSYTILNIYSFDKKKNRKKYLRQKGEEYVFEIIVPDFYLSPIQRRL